MTRSEGIRLLDNPASIMHLSARLTIMECLLCILETWEERAAACPLEVQDSSCYMISPFLITINPAAGRGLHESTMHGKGVPCTVG